PLLSLYHLLTLSFFPYPPTSEIFPLSLHDALPISEGAVGLPPAAWLKRVWRQFCDSPEVYLLLSNLCRTLPRTPRPASTTSSSQDVSMLFTKGAIFSQPVQFREFRDYLFDAR